MKNPTARLILTILCLLLVAYFAAGYAIEQGLSFKQLTSNMIDVDSVDNINIDGSDFTLIAKLFSLGANGMIGGLALLICFVELGTATAAALGAAAILRFAVYRNISYVSPAECTRAKYLFGGIALLSLLISLIVTRGYLFLYTLFVHLIPFGAFMVMFLLHLIKLSKNDPPVPDYSQMQ